jgi:hypothetical protein
VVGAKEKIPLPSFVDASNRIRDAMFASMLAVQVGPNKSKYLLFSQVLL